MFHGILVLLCLDGGCCWVVSRAPRDAHGLFSTITGLNEQLCIVTEAEQLLIGCTSAFLAS